MYIYAQCKLSYTYHTDSKGYGKVCLSPQRRSFGSGCSWKDASSSTATTGKDDTPIITEMDSLTEIPTLKDRVVSVCWCVL